MATVLIVEDDEATRALYERVLSPLFKILTCATVAEASALLQSHPVTVVVLDPNWPDESGWDFAAALGKRPDGTTVPFIACSALDERKHGLAVGAAAYLVKPVLPETLKDELARIVNR